MNPMRTLIIAAVACTATAAEIPVGTHLLLRMENSISTSSAKAGDGVHLRTVTPISTNGKIVVPVGSPQIENGVNFSARDGTGVLDGTNTRLRLGVAPCVELLVDLPTYFARVRGLATSGFSDVAPAVKWQISPVPGKIDLSAVVGVALPTGTTDIAGPEPLAGEQSAANPSRAPISLITGKIQRISSI